MSKILENIKCVYGPYLDKGRRFIIVHCKDGSRKSLSHARYLIELAIGRELTPDESVDHIDGNPLNDSPSNLQIMTIEENNRKSSCKGQYWVVFTCPLCGREGRQEKGNYINNQKRSKNGPFCSRNCSGTATHLGKMHATNVREEFLSYPFCFVSYPITVRFGVPENYIPPYPRISGRITSSVRPKKFKTLEKPKPTVLCIYCDEPCISSVYWHKDCLACIDCNAPVGTLRCRSCAGIARGTKIKYPATADLIEMLESSNYTQVAIKLDASDNAIRKHLRRNGIDPKTLKEQE